MQLTNEEREALERWRKRDVFGVFRLAHVVDRLFPVRTYGDLVIRWDDEITPERLVVCGWTRVFEKLLSYRNIDIRLSVRRVYWDDFVMPIPRNMGEVWQLMERIEGDGQ